MSDESEVIGLLAGLLGRVPVGGVEVLGPFSAPGPKEMARMSLSRGMPVITQDGDVMSLIMPMENAGTVADLISSREALERMRQTESNMEGIQLLLKGDPGCHLLMSDDIRKMVQELAAHTLNEYIAELKAYVKDSPSAAAELENVQRIKGDDILKWLISQFAKGANPAGCLSARLAYHRQRFGEIIENGTRLVKGLGSKAKKGLGRRIAELEAKLPEHQRSLTEIPVVRLSIDAVRKLMVAATMSDGGGRDGLINNLLTSLSNLPKDVEFSPEQTAKVEKLRQEAIILRTQVGNKDVTDSAFASMATSLNMRLEGVIMDARRAAEDKKK